MRDVPPIAVAAPALPAFPVLPMLVPPEAVLAGASPVVIAAPVRPAAEPVLLRSPTDTRVVRPIHRQPYAEYAVGVPQTAPAPAVAVKTPSKKELWDHEFIGGKFTICVLCYGPYEDLARRCLDGILRTVPAERLDLRVATNQACQGTIDYLRDLPLTKLYINPTNRMKYPVQREMFHDPDCPITTPYVVWFDDDSYVVDNDWASHLMHAIIDNHRQGYRLYGIKFRHDLAAYTANNHKPLSWFSSAPWYRGRPLQSQTGKQIPNGSNIWFVAGGFFALGTDVMRAADIPCARLHHNGGDITIGAQVHQHGFGICRFNTDKKFIFSSGAKRRGYHERFPWAGSPANQKRVKRG